MNFKKIAILVSFLLFFISKTDGQVLFQAYLITDKDTLTMWTKFLEFNYKITSIYRNMEVTTCFGGSFLPTWKIENDSFFLIKILKDRGFDDADSAKLIDLKAIFKERFISVYTSMDDLL